MAAETAAPVGAAAAQDERNIEAASDREVSPAAGRCGADRQLAPLAKEDGPRVRNALAADFRGEACAADRNQNVLAESQGRTCNGDFECRFAFCISNEHIRHV